MKYKHTNGATCWNTIENMKNVFTTTRQLMTTQEWSSPMWLAWSARLKKNRGRVGQLGFAGVRHPLVTFRILLSTLLPWQSGRPRGTSTWLVNIRMSRIFNCFPNTMIRENRCLFISPDRAPYVLIEVYVNTTSTHKYKRQALIAR